MQSVTVGSEKVYWRYRHGRTKAVALSRVWLTPPFTAVIGYVPWSRFARAEDLPAGAARMEAFRQQISARAADIEPTRQL